MIKIVSQTIDVQQAIQQVQSPQAGAINVFLGTVRSETRGKAVLGLEYEAYESMAVKVLHKIAEEARKQWQIQNLAIIHRVGQLAVGELAVVVALSTAHRQASFEACQYIIDTLKKTVPIWKKEIYESGEVWVSAYP